MIRTYRSCCVDPSLPQRGTDTCSTSNKENTSPSPVNGHVVVANDLQYIEFLILTISAGRNFAHDMPNNDLRQVPNYVSHIKMCVQLFYLSLIQIQRTVISTQELMT